MSLSIKIVTATNFAAWARPIQNELLNIKTDKIANEGTGRLSINKSANKNINIMLPVLNNDGINYSFQEYNVTYDHKKHRQGIVFGQQFNFYFENLKFPVYFDSKNELLILDVKKKSANAFLKELAAEQKVNYSSKKIDFKKVLSKSNRLSSIWGTSMLPNVTVQSYHGDSLIDSNEVQSMLARDKISYVTVSFIFENENINIGISKDCSFILSGTKKLDETILRQIIYIFNTCSS